MPKVTVLPHPGICPNGAEFEVPRRCKLSQGSGRKRRNIDHACEFSCACTTCHCYIDKGFDSLEPAEDDEEDLLDQAGFEIELSPDLPDKSRQEDITVEIPKYSRNHAREND